MESEVLVYDRQKLCELIFRVYEEQKFEEEERPILSFLLENDYITTKGEITQKGIEELYH